MDLFIVIPFFISMFVCLGWVYYFWKLDKYEQEPFHLLLVTFIFGAVLTLIASFLEELGLELFGLSIDDVIQNPFNSNLFLFFLYLVVVVGVMEEFVKLIPVRFYAFKQINEPIDGLIYASAAAAGFAFVENLLYIYYGFKAGFVEGLFMTLVRILTSPVHILFASYWGIALGFYKQNPAKKNDVLKGFLVAAFLHGLYDFFAFLGEIGSIGAVAVILVTIILLMKKVSFLLRISPFNNLNYFIGCKYCGGLFPAKAQYCINCGKSTYWVEKENKIHLKYFCGDCKNKLNFGQNYCTNCGLKIHWK